MDEQVDDLIDNFELLGDWEERFRYIIELGRKVPPMDPADQVDGNRVHGCQSTVWMTAGLSDTTPATLVVSADSDAHIVKGLIAVLMIIFGGKQPREVLAIDAEAIFKQLDLGDHLSPTRRNGLYAMVDRIRALAANVAA